MPSFLIVYAAPQDGRLDTFRQPPTLDVGGLRTHLDWGNTTLHVPAGDLPVTIFVTRVSGHVEGATITVRAPAGTGTRLTFMPPMQPGGSSLLRIDGQWPADSSMHYYAARDARVLQQAPAPQSPTTGAGAQRPPEGRGSAAPAATRPGAPASAVGPTPGSARSVPAHPSSFGHEQGARVDPVRPSAGPPVQQPSFGQRPQRTERDVYGREHAADDKQAPPIPTPAEFHRLEQEAAEAQRRAYEAWQAQQRASQPQLGPTPQEGAPTPIGLAVNTGQAQPNWYPDPFRRADVRWFDGRQWTASVMRGGVRATDQPG